MPINTVSTHNILPEYKKYKHLSMVSTQMDRKYRFPAKAHTHIHSKIPTLNNYTLYQI